MELLRALLRALQPLYGGGFATAFAQLACFYYLVGAALHWGLPALVTVHNIQKAPRKQGAVARDAFFSIGRCKLLLTATTDD